MNKWILILDLDGVLITTPSWKPDEMDSDGYSKFNSECVRCFNELLELRDFEIWLSSTRRKGKTLEEFNRIFKYRGISPSIQGFLPITIEIKKRREEIEQFIEEKQIQKCLIIDDDKSLNSFTSSENHILIQTEYLLGFNETKLLEAKESLNSII